MPVMPPTLGRKGLTERRRSFDQERAKARPWRGWYSSTAWRRRRAGQLKRQPLCERHLALGQVVAATVANHRQPHRGDWTLFIEGDLESVCKACHDSLIQREERVTASSIS